MSAPAGGAPHKARRGARVEALLAVCGKNAGLALTSLLVDSQRRAGANTIEMRLTHGTRGMLVAIDVGGRSCKRRERLEAMLSSAGYLLVHSSEEGTSWERPLRGASERSIELSRLVTFQRTGALAGWPRRRRRASPRGHRVPTTREVAGTLRAAKAAALRWDAWCAIASRVVSARERRISIACLESGTHRVLLLADIEATDGTSIRPAEARALREVLRKHGFAPRRAKAKGSLGSPRIEASRHTRTAAAAARIVAKVAAAIDEVIAAGATG